MPNCDWIIPCDGSECSTVTFKSFCSKCAYSVKIRSKAEMTYATDMKGVGYYRLNSIPDQKIVCESCDDNES